METGFPFLPDLIDLVFERITETGGFQGTRSALGLLGAMLDAGAAGAHLMTAASCRLTSEACADRLLDLDPTGTLINAARSNYRDLAAHSYSEAIASAVLLASLVPGDRAIGLSGEELVRHVIKPGDDSNQFPWKESVSGFSSRAKRSRQAATDYRWMPTGGWPCW